jgi:hypothetical protein
MLHWQGDLLRRYSGHVVEAADSLFLKEIKGQESIGISLRLEERCLELRREGPFSYTFFPQHRVVARNRKNHLF